MSDKIRDVIFLGILICLVVIAIKPGPQLSVNGQPQVNVSAGETVIPLGQNRIGIVDNRNNSGLYGTILVLQFEEKSKNFRLIGTYNYQDYFSNPQKYGIINGIKN